MRTALGTPVIFGALSLGDYNTRVVLLGATILGVAAALIGTFLFLRKKALIGDVVGHSALPGIAGAFIILERLHPGTGKSIPGLLMGAAVSGLIGAQSVALLRRVSRIKSDAALAVVLSVFYGGGVALLSIVQRLPTGSSAGLKDYLNGQTAAILAADVRVFGVASLLVLIVTLLFFKELTLLCFDEDYGHTAGLPVHWLDVVLTFLAAAVTVTGMQTVGLLLVTAILVIPPCCARFWTNRVRTLALASGGIGGFSAAVGVLISASYSHLPAGPMIVLAGGGVFLVSLVFGREGGIRWGGWHHRTDANRADRLDLLRAIFEVLEGQGIAPDASPLASSHHVKTVISGRHLEPFRTWPTRRLDRALKRAAAEGLLTFAGPGEFGVTHAAWEEACRVARNHRLWELYLIRYADVAPALVDRNADMIEHVLDPAIVSELQRALKGEGPAAIPRTPHALPG